MSETGFLFRQKRKENKHLRYNRNTQRIFRVWKSTKNTISEIIF
jgi:hypothetical protein